MFLSSKGRQGYPVLTLLRRTPRSNIPSVCASVFFLISYNFVICSTQLRPRLQFRSVTSRSLASAIKISLTSILPLTLSITARRRISILLETPSINLAMNVLTSKSRNVFGRSVQFNSIIRLMLNPQSMNNSAGSSRSSC